VTAGTPRAPRNAASSKKAASAPTWGPAEPFALWILQIVLSSIWALLLAAVFFSGSFPDPAPIWFLGASALMIWFVYIAGPIVVTRARGNGPVADLGATVIARDVPIGLTVGVALQLLVLPVVYWPILQLTDTEPGTAAKELVDRIDGPIDLMILTLVVAVGAPLAEEFFYRGLLLQGLRRRLPDLAAIVISSALFALVHIDPILYPGTFILGLVTATVTIRTGRLGLAWAMHVGFNGATLVLLLLSG